ncbi:MAG: hypothetical protein ACYTAF_12840, partial [Planctomycetota bacterium]
MKPPSWREPETGTRKQGWKISAGGRDYLWSIERDGEFMVVVVEGTSGRGQRLVVAVERGSMHVPVPGGGARTTKRKQVSPYVVKKIISEGLRNGWKPDKAARDLRLRLVGDML